jgi:peptide/nickel transport system permease protein
MRVFIFRRLIETAVSVLIVSIMTFSLVQLIPGDPVLSLVGTETHEEEIQRLRKEMGFDKPLVLQYVHWVSKVAQGDFGMSLRYKERVNRLIAQSAPISLFLGAVSFAIGMLLGIPAGIVTAIRRGKILDSVITTCSNIGIAIPVFWLGVLLIYFFGVHLGWLPVSGYTSPFENLGLCLRKMVMPVACLSLFQIAILARQTRSSMLEVVQQDYIRTAWSKGLSERIVIIRHALKNAFIPVITVGGVLVAQLVGGAVLTETIFNIPGMGRLIVTGVLQNDYVVVQGCTLAVALLVAFINLIVDISYAWLDPRIRLN